MDKIKLNINRKDIETYPDRTIMEVADENNIHIPRLCYHPRLSIQAACRLCVVEVENARNLVASCAYPVTEGIKIITDSGRIEEARKTILELIISNHPLDCMTCEQCGNCLLQKYAYEYGVSNYGKFAGSRSEHNVDTKNPFFIADYNKCILCGRCVTTTKEIQYCNVLDFSHRGFKVRPSAEFGKTFDETECVFCGNCVSTCPTGALLEKERLHLGREWELKRVESICPYCGVGCNLNLFIKDNRIVKVEGRDSGVVNQGWLCVKGRFGLGFVNHPDRLKKPLVRKNDSFQETGWTEALHIMAKEFKRIREKYGADSLAVLASAKCTNEENYLIQKFARACLGTNNVDHCARLCHAPSVTALGKTLGSGAMTNSYEGILKTDCIFIIGNNTSETHPVTSIYIKKAVNQNNAKLIIADPREIDFTKYSSVWMRQKSGTDVALINGMMKVIIGENLVNKKFIKTRTEGYEDFEKEIKETNLDEVSKITGVSKDNIIKAARIYATSNSAMIFWGMGITQHTTGTDNATTLSNLALLTGHIGKENSGLCPLRGQSNVQGSCDMGSLPDVYPGYQKVNNKQVHKKFSNAWKSRLSSDPGLTVVEIMHLAKEGKIKGLYIIGENPMISDPNINEVRKGLENLEFLVVQDIFLTETAELADLVLPAASFAEKDGTFTNSERRIQRLNKTIEPVGESKPDWQIICELSNIMGYHMKYNHPSEIMDEIATLTPIYAGVSYDRIGSTGLQWPCPDKNHPGTQFLHKDKFTRGHGKFIFAKYIPAAEATDTTYPYLLTTGRILFQYHTRTMTGKVDGLNWKAPSALVEISTVDAMKLKCKDGDMLKVSSKRGEITAKAYITDKVPRGEVFISFHYKDAAANFLTIDALDPQSKIPEYKVCSVKIEKV